MSIDWKGLGAIVADAAPLLGSALGPLGAAGGALIASALGVPNEPDAISRAVRADPDAAVALRRLEMEHRAHLAAASLEAATAAIRATNATMRREDDSDKWWVSGWRAFWGFSSALAWSFLAGCLGVCVCRGELGVAVETFAAVPETFWLIPLTILGVASWHRGKEKRVRAGEAPASGVLDGLLKTARGQVHVR